MKNLTEQRNERMKLVTRMRTINDLAEKEKRQFTTDETEEYNRLEAEVDSLGASITAEEQRTARADKLRAIELGLGTSPEPVTKPTPTGGVAARNDVFATPEYRGAFSAYLERGIQGAQAYLAEHRADTLQAGLFTKGGALQMPMEMVNELIKAVDNDVFVLQYCRKFRLAQAASLGVPKLDTDVDDFDWTAELLTGSQGDMTFGRRELRCHPAAKRLKVSKTLSRVSALPIEALVRERLQYKQSVTKEKAYLTGTGVQQPLGVYTASDDGVPTSQDVSTGNTSTSITFDGLMEAMAAMKPAHLRDSRWNFHRTGIKQIRKLKDGQGQYLWAPAVSGGVPSTILGIPYDQSEYTPSTFTTGLYVGGLFNWSYYWAVDALDMTIQILGELYAETNQDGYIARFEGDGAPVLAEAFVRVKLA